MHCNLEGVRIHDLDKQLDERGFFVEALRQDWGKFLEGDIILQSALSLSQPGVVRAWHRHLRGQVDYLLIIQGTVRIAVYDAQEGSTTSGKLFETLVAEDRLQLVRIPGHYWHGTKSVGDKPSLTLYFFTKLYDYANPDEERLPANSPYIINPMLGCPYDWNGPLLNEKRGI
ncbi:dTDP-4-dehydrorhamnose 3,5-epimerase family protein [Chloroflexota bacterium]